MIFIFFVFFVFFAVCVSQLDARTNVADPNKVCDKALASGSKITTMVIAFIKTVKQVTLCDEGAVQHHVVQLVPTDASRIHDAISELQRLLETWTLVKCLFL